MMRMKYLKLKSTENKNKESLNERKKRGKKQIK
jgi:hypothetical protein